VFDCQLFNLHSVYTAGWNTLMAMLNTSPDTHPPPLCHGFVPHKPNIIDSRTVHNNNMFHKSCTYLTYTVGEKKWKLFSLQCSPLFETAPLFLRSPGEVLSFTTWQPEKSRVRFPMRSSGFFTDFFRPHYMPGVDSDSDKQVPAAATYPGILFVEGG
jgi:hypothetical protein